MPAITAAYAASTRAPVHHESWWELPPCDTPAVMADVALLGKYGAMLAPQDWKEKTSATMGSTMKATRR